MDGWMDRSSRYSSPSYDASSSSSQNARFQRDELTKVEKAVPKKITRNINLRSVSSVCMRLHACWTISTMSSCTSLLFQFFVLRSESKYNTVEMLLFAPNNLASSLRCAMVCFPGGSSIDLQRFKRNRISELGG